jgi:hypothetical protein
MLNRKFTFLCTEDERVELTRLAESFHRSRGDTLRMLLREAATGRGVPDVGVALLYEKQSITAKVKDADKSTK